MGWSGIRFELGQAIQSTYDASGFLRVQHDGLGEAPNVGSSEVLHPGGLAYRARDPEVGPDGKAKDGGGSKILVAFDGTEYKIIYVGDQRALAGIPPLAKGSSVQYAHTAGPPSFDVHSGEDGTKQIYVEIGDSAHVITVGRDGNGEPVLELTHADGMAISMFRESLTIKNKDGTVFAEFARDKGTLSGNWKVVGDITNAEGVSLFHHTHLTPFGPSGPPLPSLA
jgi:hypothetical protein